MVHPVSQESDHPGRGPGSCSFRSADPAGVRRRFADWIRRGIGLGALLCGPAARYAREPLPSPVSRLTPLMITSAVTALLVGLLPQVPPQGLLVEPAPGGAKSPIERLAFPAYVDLTRFAPFEDAQGAPQATDVAASGAADFDGDGNEDLWLLPTSGVNAGALSVQMARISSLGRFRGWQQLAPRSWVDGATFRSTDYPLGDRVLLVEPLQSDLVSAYYTYPFGGSPQAGTFVVNASWTVGAGSFEIATRDDDGDGHDDIAVLQAVLPGWTRVKKLCMGNSLGWLHPEQEVSCDLPLVASDLQLFDYDGDGRSDVLVRISTTGLLLLHDDGSRLVPVSLIVLPVPVKDVFVGDADRDGRDDFGLVFSTGILLARSEALHFSPVWLAAPAGVGSLGTARVLGETRGNLTSVTAFPADGQSVVLFPFLGSGMFAPAEIETPPDPGPYQGSGAQGARVIVADIDGDEDDDVVMQLADRTHWVSLLGGEFALAPHDLQTVDQGLLGETGYRQYDLVAEIPDEAVQRGLTTVEMAVFLQDITVQPADYIYWGRLLLPVDPNTRTVSFTVFSQTEKAKLHTMIQNRDVFRFPGGITAGGQALLSLHCKSGPQRFESLLIHHDDPEGNKSAVGVQWNEIKAPPEPAMDSDLLPWS